MSGERAVKVGDRIRDNDPWMIDRVLVVKAVEEGRRHGQDPATFVIASKHGGDDKTHQTRIRLDRIHTDGKPRRSGWSLVRLCGDGRAERG